MLRLLRHVSDPGSTLTAARPPILTSEISLQPLLAEVLKSGQPFRPRKPLLLLSFTAQQAQHGSNFLRLRAHLLDPGLAQGRGPKVKTAPPPHAPKTRFFSSFPDLHQPSPGSRAAAREAAQPPPPPPRGTAEFSLCGPILGTSAAAATTSAHLSTPHATPSRDSPI